MEITKRRVRNAGIITGVVGTATEYASASLINSIDYLKNYQYTKMMDSIDYNAMHPIENFQHALSNDAFIQLQPFLIAGTLFMAGKYLFKKTVTYEDASDYGAYGTARWAKDNEIFNPENITTNYDKEGIIHGLHKRKPVIQHEESYLNRNTCLVGGSGAGKTRANIIPNILKNKEKSMVVIDPKGELYEKTSEAKRKQGYEVHLVNFKNRDISDRYNLFEYIRKDSDAFKIADQMVNSAGEGSKINKDFWNQKQIAVLQALQLYVKYTLPKEQQHMGSVMAMAGLGEGELKELFEDYPKNHIVSISYQTAIEQLKEKTFGDVFATMTNTLNPWLYEDVCKFTAANDFLFEDLGKKKMIVYVIIPIADNEFKPLITTFFTQMFSELYRLADQNYGVLPKGVMLELDEFANIGKIPNFDERLSTTRSLGIEVSIVLQNTSQLEKVYGKEEAKEIINNCDIRLLLKANEYETAKYFSQMAGKTTVRVKNQSSSNGNKSSSTSESVNYIGRDLITPDEVLRLKKNEQLLFLAGQYPMKIKKSWFNKIKYFKKMLGKKVSRDNYPVVDRGEYTAFQAEVKSAIQPEFDEVLFVPYETPEGKTVDSETGEILEELSQQEDEPKKEKDPLEDLMDAFKY